MTARARASSNCKLQTHPLVGKRVNTRTMIASVQLKISGREFQGSWSQDELTGGKPPILSNSNSDSDSVRNYLQVNPVILHRFNNIYYVFRTIERNTGV
jgi:hypothetical protein